MQNTITKILIVDDIEDNRLIIKRICKKIENIELLEAKNGQEAVETTRTQEPHIVLMDIMMPIMDGFEASTIIKSEFPDTHIIVITALTDEDTEKNFLKLGIDGYLKKPLARGVLKVKLEGLIATLKIKDGSSSILSSKCTLNPFNQKIRKMKTIFDIETEDDMMNLGLWLTDYYTKRNTVTTMDFDFSLDMTYQYIKGHIKDKLKMSVIVEEDFNDVYLVFISPNDVCENNFDVTVEERIKNNVIFSKGLLHLKIKMKYDYQPEALMAEDVINSALANIEYTDDDFSSISSSENINGLGCSLEHKISASEFISSLDSDVANIITILEGTDEKSSEILANFAVSKSNKLLGEIAEEVISQYANIINKLYEFNTIGYGLSSITLFLKTADEIQVQNNANEIYDILSNIIKLLAEWRNGIFISKDFDDIHKLDNSILYLCTQMDVAVKTNSDKTNMDTEGI